MYLFIQLNARCKYKITLSLPVSKKKSWKVNCGMFHASNVKILTRTLTRLTNGRKLPFQEENDVGPGKGTGLRYLQDSRLPSVCTGTLYDLAQVFKLSRSQWCPHVRNNLVQRVVWLVSKFHKTLVNPSMILEDLSSAPCEYALSGFNGSELQRGVRMGGIYYNRYKGAFLNV